MSFAVNFLGTIPINPDNLPEESYIFGQGTGRPLGFEMTEIVSLYWTARAFQVNILSFSIGADALDAFLSAGGSSGGVIGANVGLSAVQGANAGQNSSIVGYTQGIVKHDQKIRVQPEGIHNGKTQTSTALDKKISPNILISRNFLPNEGNISAAGPLHLMVNGSGYCLIDFSNIIYANGLYWPTIIIQIGSGNFILCSQSQAQNNVTCIGGVSFGNYGVISFYGYSATPPYNYSIQGNVNIGNRCSDRYYWDGHDDDRAKDCPTWNQTSSSPNAVSRAAQLAAGNTSNQKPSF